jgi:hypothetical protein
VPRALYWLAFRSRTLHPRDFRLVATLSLTQHVQPPQAATPKHQKTTPLEQLPEGSAKGHTKQAKCAFPKHHQAPQVTCEAPVSR